jgi:hypothetical protein
MRKGLTRIIASSLNEVHADSGWLRRWSEDLTRRRKNAKSRLA